MRIALQVISVLLLVTAMFIAAGIHREISDLRDDLQQLTDRLDRTAVSTTRASDTETRLSNVELVALRRLIRDELQALEARWNAGIPDFEQPTSARSRPPNDQFSTPPSSGLSAEPDSELQHRLVQEEIDLFIGRGEISNSEMAVLQGEIARLAPQDRIDAMRRLVAAINAGELDGRL